MDILEQHQVVCTIKLCYQNYLWAILRKGGVLMVLPQKLEYVYIIVNIFVNTQSILNILASKRNGFKGLCLCKKHYSNVYVMKVNEGHNLYHSDLSRCFVITLYVFSIIS